MLILYCWHLDRLCFLPELFLRGMPHLCRRMKRLTPQDIADRQSEHESDVPDFYAISQANPLPRGVNSSSSKAATMLQNKSAAMDSTPNLSETSEGNQGQSNIESMQDFSTQMPSSETMSSHHQQHSAAVVPRQQDAQMELQSVQAYQHPAPQQAPIQNNGSTQAQVVDLAALQKRRDQLLSKIVSLLCAQVTRSQSTEQLEFIANFLSAVPQQGSTSVPMNQPPLQQHSRAVARTTPGVSQDQIGAILQLLRNRNPQQSYVPAPPVPAAPPAQHQTTEDLMARIRNLVARHQEGLTTDANQHSASLSKQSGIPTQISVQQKEDPSPKTSSSENLSMRRSMETAASAYGDGKASSTMDLLQQLINQARSRPEIMAQSDQQSTRGDPIRLSQETGTHSMIPNEPPKQPQNRQNAGLQATEASTVSSQAELLSSLLAKSGGPNGLQTLLQSMANRNKSTLENPGGSQTYSDIQPYRNQEQKRDGMDMSNSSRRQSSEQTHQVQQSQLQQQTPQPQEHPHPSNNAQLAVNTEMLNRALSSLQDPNSRELLQQLFRRATWFASWHFLSNGLIIWYDQSLPWYSSPFSSPKSKISCCICRGNALLVLHLCIISLHKFILSLLLY